MLRKGASRRPRERRRNHAGYSVWADEKWAYVNLNESFLGVSFEARTVPGQKEADISPARVRAAAMLTEVLRSRYGIPTANCVTQAQVSVNPSHLRVGYHTDWAGRRDFHIRRSDCRTITGSRWRPSGLSNSSTIRHT